MLAGSTHSASLLELQLDAHTRSKTEELQPIQPPPRTCHSGIVDVNPKIATVGILSPPPIWTKMKNAILCSSIK